MKSTASDPFEQESRHLIPGLQQICVLSGLVLDRASGVTVWDRTGKGYLDLWAGGGVCSVGHSHPRFVDAIAHQLRTLIVGTFSSSVRGAYLERLAEVLPHPLTRAHLFSSGAEAVEASLRLARAYTGHRQFLSFTGAFHGKTFGALTLTDAAMKSAYEPLLPGCHMSPFGSPGRCGSLGECPNCDSGCILRAREVIDETCAGDLAAIIVEPIQGHAGCVLPADGFLPGLRRLADEYEALLIFDEMVTGFGRTGSMFACQDFHVIPDILIVGKGMGNGIPVSGIVTTESIGTAPPFAASSGSSSSYGGNPLAAAAALVTLDILTEEALPSNARVVGTSIRDSLAMHLQGSSLVGQVGGRGLLIGIELIDPRGGGPLASKHCLELFRRLLARGILAHAVTPRLRIHPPLCIDEDAATRAVTTIVETIDELAGRIA